MAVLWWRFHCSLLRMMDSMRRISATLHEHCDFFTNSTAPGIAYRNDNILNTFRYRFHFLVVNHGIFAGTHKLVIFMGCLKIVLKFLKKKKKKKMMMFKN